MHILKSEILFWTEFSIILEIWKQDEYFGKMGLMSNKIVLKCSEPNMQI